MTSQLGKQTIAISILPNMSLSKGNQTMKFGQLVARTQNQKCFSGKIIHKIWWRNHSQVLKIKNWPD